MATSTQALDEALEQLSSYTAKSQLERLNLSNTAVSADGVRLVLGVCPELSSDNFLRGFRWY